MFENDAKPFTKTSAKAISRTVKAMIPLSAMNRMTLAAGRTVGGASVTTAEPSV